MITIGVRFKSSNTAKGATAEKAVASQLRSQGYKVKRLRLSGHDLEVTNPSTGEIVKIEVKFSSQNKDGKFRATTIKQGATDHRKSDVIIFVCQPKFTGGDCVTFIIPSKVQADKTFLCVTSNPNTYSGKLSEYKERWDLVA